MITRKKIRKRTSRALSKNRTLSARRRVPQEPTINFFKLKVYICVCLFLFVVAMNQFDLKIGEFTSDQIYDILYYDENLEAFNEKYLNFDMNAIKTFWNQQGEKRSIKEN